MYMRIVLGCIIKLIGWSHTQAASETLWRDTGQCRASTERAGQVVIKVAKGKTVDKGSNSKVILKVTKGKDCGMRLKKGCP